MLTIYHNPRCAKSRETLQLINDENKDVEVIEYLKQPPTEDELRGILSKLNLPIDYLIRKKEAIYKSEFKGRDLSEDEWISALVKYPKLLERPIVVKDDQALLGRPPENVKKFF
jgi:arsenate reductase